MLVPQVPYPPRQGAAIRNYHFLRWLAARHDVSLLAYGSDPEAPAHLRDLCAEVAVVSPGRRTTGTRLRDLVASGLPDLALRLYSPALAAELERRLAGSRFDVVQVECLETSLAWMRVRRRAALGAQAPRAIFDDHNAEYALQWRAFANDLGKPPRWPAAAYSLLQSAKLRRYERLLCSMAERVVAVSHEDAAALRRLGLRDTPAVIPNGVDCSYFAFRAVEPCPPSQRILFTGAMGYRPNVDAVVWFATRVLPLVRRDVPDATFVIVGANPAPAVRRLTSEPGVVVTGAVEDVRPYLAGCGAFVVPLRVGGGTRLKVLEAMAAGVPLVSTTLGCSGIAAEPGRHYLRADEPRHIASSLADVLLGRVDCSRMLAEARRLVEERYEWSQVCRGLDAVYASLGGEPGLPSAGRPEMASGG